MKPYVQESRNAYTGESSSIKSDLTQLLVMESKLFQQLLNKTSNKSLCPTPYIPPSFRKTRYESVQTAVNSNRIEKNNVDMFNIDIEEEKSAGFSKRLDPIALARRANDIIRRKSSGTSKRHPRTKSPIIEERIRKLPPPPIGETIGHGVIKI